MIATPSFNLYQVIYDRYQKLCDRINHWLFIERIAFLVLCLVTIYFIWYVSFSFLFISPQKERTPRIEALKNDLTVLEKKLKTIAVESQATYKQKQERKLKLVQQTRLIDNQIKTLNKKLMDPVEVGILLRDALSREAGLQLRELITRPAKILVDRTQYNDQILSESTIVLQFSGEYFSTINYLQALEKTDFQISWVDLDYNVVKYPTANIVLTCSFLSEQ